MIKWIIIFLALFFTDIIWALYIRWSAQGRALRAGIASIFIYVVGAFTFGEFIKDAWILIPAGLGCFVGTYTTIKYLDAGVV
jgi:multidrug transporter EmrE-like cation transporter